MKKITNILTVSVFFLLITGFFIANIIIPDGEISYSERRKLKQFPEITLKSIFDAQYSVDFEEYALDQFVMRDAFRTVKSAFHFYLLGHKDNNDIYIAGDTVSKIEYPLKEDQVQTGISKINSVIEKYFSDDDVYFALIPDKNYYIAEENGYPVLDYEKMTELIRSGLEGVQYIDLTSSLSADDYYVTDTHWRQEELEDVRKTLADAMEMELPSFDSYKKNELYPFYGVYYGQSALPLSPDRIVYLTNEATEFAEVFNYETNKSESVYMLDKFSGTDSYDIFLTGPAALQEIKNPLCDNGRSLVVFRDSFGSSIIPLLIDSYEKILVVDLRYMPADLLGSYMDVNEESDVLFMYSTLIMNSASMLR